MQRKKLCLSALSAVVLVLSLLRPAYRVTVLGGETSGALSLAGVYRALSAAEAAAEELSEGYTSLPEYRVRLCLTLGSPDGNGTALAENLLSECDGVTAGWNVVLDGELIGRTADSSAMLELAEQAIASGSDPSAVSAGLDRELRLERAFFPEGGETELMSLSRSLRENSRVVSVFADGSVLVGD